MFGININKALEREDFGMKLSEKINEKTGRNLVVNEGLNTLYMKNEFNTYCPLGKDIRLLTIETWMTLGDYIPNFLCIEDLVKDMTDGIYTNEDALLTWVNYLEVYKPLSLTVKVSDNSKFPITEELTRTYKY